MTPSEKVDPSLGTEEEHYKKLDEEAANETQWGEWAEKYDSVEQELEKTYKQEERVFWKEARNRKRSEDKIWHAYGMGGADATYPLEQDIFPKVDIFTTSNWTDPQEQRADKRHWL